MLKTLLLVVAATVAALLAYAAFKPDTFGLQRSATIAAPFGNGRVVHTQRWGEGTPYPAGSVMAVSFELHGQPLIAFNGGPHFKLNEAASLFVQCDDQAEVDRLWDGLIAGGGAPSRCGWLKDRFGLSWQIVPKAHMQMTSSGDSAQAARLMQAMMKMRKFDIAALQRAYDGH